MSQLSWLTGESLGYRINEYEGYSSCQRKTFDVASIGSVPSINQTIAISTERLTFTGLHSRVGPIELTNYFKTEAWFASLKTNISGRRLAVEGIYFSCASQSSRVVCEMAVHLFPYTPSSNVQNAVIRGDDIANLLNITDVIIIPLDPAQDDDGHAAVAATLEQHLAFHKKGAPSSLILAVNPLPLIQRGTFHRTLPLPLWRYPCRNATFWLRVESVLVDAGILASLHELTAPAEGVITGSFSARVVATHHFSVAALRLTASSNTTLADRFRIVNGDIDLRTTELTVAIITLGVLCLQALVILLYSAWKRRTFISDLRSGWVHPLTQRQFFGVPKKAPLFNEGSDVASSSSRNPLVPPGQGM